MPKLFVIFTLAILAFSSFAFDDESHPDRIPRTDTKATGGDFELSSSQGTISLKQLRGKVVALYFGYTKCPDVCPSSLAILSQALNELSEDELESVQALFISVDPGRDNFVLLDEYVSYFHPNLAGVTGSQEEVAAVAEAYGAQYEKVTIKDSGFGYAINHSADIYLISPEGQLRFMFPHETPSYVILEAIRYLME